MHRQEDNDSLASVKAELEKIKEECARLANKISSIESAMSGAQNIQGEKLSSAPVIPPPSPEILPTPFSEEAPLPSLENPPLPKPGKTDLETDLGKFWLNKIGIIIFALGIAFLITYTFRYFGPLAKIIFGYLVGAVLFAWGVKLEKREAFVAYGRALLGGGRAIVYFTTYAMYHFDASRIISSQLLDLCLLGCVSLGIITHSLRYKSEMLTAMALSVGYVTSTFGQVSQYTLISSGLLALVTIALVVKMQWIRIIFYGIVFTYCAHYFWTIKHIILSPVHLGIQDVKRVYFLLNAGFLAVYWIIFTTAIHCIKKSKHTLAHDTLSLANVINLLLFFLMLYPKFAIFYAHLKFNFVLGLGVLYLVLAVISDRLLRPKLCTSNILIAVSLLTMAVPLKFASSHTSVVWLVEVPFLVAMGFIFNRPSLRYFCMVLGLVMVCKFLAHDLFASAGIWAWQGTVSWQEFLAGLGFLSSLGCYLLYYRFKSLRPLPYHEDMLRNGYSVLIAVYLGIFLQLRMPPLLLTPALFLAMFGILLGGYVCRDVFVRLCGLVFFVIASFRFCLVDDLIRSQGMVRWDIVCIDVFIAFSAYLMYRRLDQRGLLATFEARLKNCVFYLATFLAVVAIFRCAASSWVSVSLGVLGVCLIVGGFALGEKVVRLGGFIVFVVTLLRVVFVDLSELPIIFKIISFILLGGLFLGVSFLYTKLGSDKINKTTNLMQ